ncbi:MAG TPA: AAA family ATPase, partial [Candidatus Limnocylindria bacterium]|nr:AAA family ATPase [Candidatus Limnocylindria bacterium]
REVARHDGAEIKTEGDSFYVVFESPSVALDCAVALLRAADLRSGRDPTAPLRIGIGLHAGETIAYDDQFVGSAVNIASRLAGKAGAGEILISDTLRGLVRTSRSLPMSERGALELKGVAEPIRAWTVDWHEARPAPATAETPAPPERERLAPPSGQFLCPVVIGRSAETARVDAALAQARSGHGQTVVLGGEAGVGKSAFVRRAQEKAVGEGARVLVGLTHQSDAGLPYAPFISAVRSGFRGLDRDELGRVLQRSAPDLAQLFPELGRLGRAEATSGIERHRLAVAFQHLFRAFARETPVLLVLEDLHWADEASLELLRHLARELRDARVVTLATYRSDEMHRRHPLLRALAELQRERVTTEISLRRLTPDETKEVIRATFAQSDPNVQISDEFRDAIYARSEGNPFFTEELLKAVVESGGVYFDAATGWQRKPIEELEIPSSIREAVRARLERLSEEARQTIVAAGVIGHRFAFDVLRAVRGVDDPALEAQLRELIDEQLMSEVEGGRDEFSFRHALTREVVYDDLLVRERKRLHRVVADALASLPATEPSLLAHHLLAAGEQERAVPVLIEAADRAMRTGAPREAAAHYARAVEIGPPETQLASVVERQAEAYLPFDTGLSIKAAQEALDLYRRVGDRRGQSRMLRLEGRGHFYENRHDVAERRTQEAIDVLGSDECAELGRAVAQLAGLLMTRTAMQEAIPLAERAIALGERFDDPWTLANALVTRGSAVRGERGLPFLRRGLDVALRNGIHEAAQRAYNNTTIALIVSAAPADERRALVNEGLEYGRRHGHERATATYLLSHLATLQFGEGEWDAALATIAKMDETSGAYQWAIAQRAWIVAAREDPERALPNYARLAEKPAGDPAFRVSDFGLLAYGSASAGRHDEARAWLAKLDELLARYPSGGADLDTPRSVLGGPLHQPLLATALYIGEPRWIDIVATEMRRTGIELGQRHHAAAARALAAGDAEACAREVAAGRALFERLGFEAMSTQYAINCLRVASAGGLELGPEWRSLAGKMRSFAERAGARWWLSVLGDAGL